MGEKGILGSDLPALAANLEKEATSAMGEGDYGKAKFAAWPAGDRPLNKAWPVNFRVKEPEGKLGALVEKLRPPSGEGDAPPAPDDE